MTIKFLVVTLGYEKIQKNVNSLRLRTPKLEVSGVERKGLTYLIMECIRQTIVSLSDN
jgi:hypothetical protein